MGERSSFEKVIVLIAALNEEKGIGLTLEELNQFLNDYEVLVIDGKSTDKTVSIARDYGAHVLVKEDLGKGDAIANAIASVKVNPKYVIFIDADFTYPGKYLPTMISILEKNPNIGMVCGNRFNSHFHLRSMRNLFYFGNRMLAFTHNLLNGVHMRDPLTGLRVIKWKLLRDWHPNSKGFDIEVELNHHIERQGYEITEIPIDYRDRLGEKKLKLKHGITILKRIMLESAFSHKSSWSKTNS